MKQVIVRYKVKADRAEENIAFVQKVFEELAASAPDGLIVSGAGGRPPQALWGSSSRLTIAAVFPLASPTSASLSAVIICSGVCRLLPMLTSL